MNALHARAWAHAFRMQAIDERRVEAALAELQHAVQQAELRIEIADLHAEDRRLAQLLEPGQPESPS
jgi:hypothetical protein